MRRGKWKYHAKQQDGLPSPSCSLSVHASTTFQNIAVGSICCDMGLENIDL